jgi:D-glycero-D-manno-heptose 1,7-bisphosphate phosphatase
VFLDRDGTIVADAGYLDRVERVAPFPWTADALRLLRRAGYALVVVTNQSGVARGYFPEARVHEIHAEVDRRLARGDAGVDAYFHCPHYPGAADPAYARECTCRKPAPGLVERAVRELGLDVARSFVVGDKWSDVELAMRVGARGLLIQGRGTTAEPGSPPPGVTAAAIVPNLAAAASWILAATRRT